MRPLPIMSILAGLCLSAAGAAQTGVVDRISGSDGGWDYASVDVAAGRLYVARSSDVTVVDLAAGKALVSIGSIARGHAVVPLPDQSLLVVTSGQDDSVRFLDTRDGHEIGRVAVGKKPDAAFYAAALKLVVVMNAGDGTVSEIDPANRTIVRTISLKPGLEFAQQGPGNALFVNNEDENELETADLSTGKAGTAIPLTGCQGPTGLAYDTQSGLLISACANGKAAVVDAKSRKLLKLLDIGQGPDAVILDAARRRAYVPCGRDGTLSVIALDGGQGPNVVKVIETERGTRTGALDPRSGRLYLPTAGFASAQAGQRPQMVPGTFHVLVVKPD